MNRYYIICYIFFTVRRIWRLDMAVGKERRAHIPEKLLRKPIEQRHRRPLACPPLLVIILKEMCKENPETVHDIEN